jgi:hypothetical protein
MAFISDVSRNPEKDDAMGRIGLRLAAAALALTLGAPAFATQTFTDAQYKQAYTALNAMESLSLMTFGNASTQSDIGGRVWVGGSFNGNSIPVNSGAVANGGSATVNSSSFATLTAGSLGSNIQVNSGTNASRTALIGNANGNSIIYNGGSGTTTTTTSSAIASQATTYKADAQQLSTLLDTLTSTGIYQSTEGNALSLSSGLNVFSMTTSVFNDQNMNFSNLFSNLTSSETVVINVVCGGASSCSAAMAGGANFNANNNAALISTNVIWNFTTANSSTLTPTTANNTNSLTSQATGSVTDVSVKQFFGSVLAPDATVSNSSPINGSVMASMFNGSGEIHLGNYAGTESFIPSNDRSLAGAVPEPSVWMVMIIGFGIIGATIRRDRKAGVVLMII